MTEQPEPIQTTPPPQTPPPAQTPPEKKSNPLALLSLIAGIISVLALLINFCVPCVGVPGVLFGIAGAVMGFIARKQIDESQGEQTGRQMAVIGMITGIVGAGVSLLWSLIRFILGLLGVGAGLFEGLIDMIFSGFF